MAESSNQGIGRALPTPMVASDVLGMLCSGRGLLASPEAARRMRKPRMRMHYCPPLPLLWSSLRGEGTPASRIHKLYLRGLWRRSWSGRLGTALAFLAWPSIVLAMAAVATVVNGRQALRRSGRSLPYLVADELWMAARYGILPLWYFIYELELPERRQSTSAFILRYEAKGGLYKLLRYFAGSRDDKTLNDKVACFRACYAAGITTPQVHAVLQAGNIAWTTVDKELPALDLFVKQVKGQGGAGAERWLYKGACVWDNGRGLTLDSARLLARLQARSKRRPLLVQQRVRNHAALADLNCDALATVRLLSIWDENGQPEVTNAALKMPSRWGAVTDNFCAGGIAASVDLATGKLGAATNYGLTTALHWWDTHPATGARIEGRALPMWPETLAFARRAHETFIEFPVIGFDIASTPNGPCLIEANASSALDLIQRTARGPIGNARFGELLALHLEHAEAWRRKAVGENGD